MIESEIPKVNSAHPTAFSMDEFRQHFDPIVVEWRTHSGDGLRIRHKTGKVLNDHLGTPDTRQTRGQGVVSAVCGQLGITPGEVSRIRWFAHVCKSPEDLRARYSEAVSWTAFKGILPKLKAEMSKPKGNSQSGGYKSGSAGTMKPPMSKRMVKRLQRFSEDFRKVQLDLSGEDLRDLQSQISVILEQVRNRYFERASVQAGAVAYTPLAQSCGW